MNMQQNICFHSRPPFIPAMFFAHFFLLILLLTLASARTFSNRQERHIDELVVYGSSGESSQPISILFLPGAEQKGEKLESELSAPYEETLDESGEEEKSERDMDKRNTEEETTGGGKRATTPTGNGRPRSHSELFTRMRSICAKMPRLKRKRTPKPGSAESLVAFLCSNTNMFRRR